MAYVEQVGIKRQVGGKSGEIRYWYPLTKPIKTAFGILLIVISYTSSTSKTTSSRCYQRCQGSADIFRVGERKTGTNGKDDISSCRIAALPESERFPNNALETVPLHRTMNLAVHTDSQPARTGRIRPADQSKTFSVQPPSLAVNFVKLPTFADQGAFQKSMPGQSYADSLLRPFARRDLMTALPARVLILSRNPWVRLRFRLLG